MYSIDQTTLASWLTEVQAELLAILSAAGVTPSAAVSNQVLTSIEILMSTYGGLFSTDSGSANAYAGTLIQPPISLAAGCTVALLIANSNTGASTLDLNALGAAAIKKRNYAGVLSDLTGGDLIAGNIYGFVYDGASWQLLDTQAVTGTDLQNAAPLRAAAAGTANAITASFSPAILSLVDGMRLNVMAAAANTSATPTFTPNPGTVAAVTIVKGAGAALAVGDIPAAHYDMELLYNSTLSAWVLLNPATGIGAVPSVVGTCRNLKAYPSSPTSVTFYWDELIVKSALGGTAYLATNDNGSTFNTTTIGAGGMDTGNAPTSGYFAVYAIYNPTTAAIALLGQNATSAAVSSVYGGSHMPAGYTASALISVLPTNSSAQMVAFNQVDRKIITASQFALTTTTSYSTPQTLSISGFVPPNAREVYAAIAVTSQASPSGQSALTLNGSPTGEGYCVNWGPASTFASTTQAPSTPITMVTPQTLYYRTDIYPGGSAQVIVSGYTI